MKPLKRIPLSTDIPVFGKVFERKGLNRSKKNLMVFIKTSIVHDGLEGTVMSQTKYQYIKRKQANHHDNLMNIDKVTNQNRLPPWESTRIAIAIREPRNMITNSIRFSFAKTWCVINASG